MRHCDSPTEDQKTKKRKSHPRVVVLIGRASDRQLGDHLGVVWDFGGCADSGGADVADAAALGGGSAVGSG